MTDFRTVQMTAVYPLMDKTKGDFSNRAACTSEHIKNNFKSAATQATIGAVATGAGYAAVKSPGIAKVLATPVRYAVKMMKGTSFGRYLNFLPPKYKALIAIGLTALGVSAYYGNKTSYKAGQIDQKYTDLANIKNKACDAVK